MGSWSEALPPFKGKSAAADAAGGVFVEDFFRKKLNMLVFVWAPDFKEAGPGGLNGCPLRVSHGVTTGSDAASSSPDRVAL